MKEGWGRINEQHGFVNNQRFYVNCRKGTLSAFEAEPEE